MKKILLMGLPLIALSATQGVAQTRGISGRVTDRATGEGLPGVTVLLKGTNNGVSTNSDGTYTLTIPAGDGTLVFSSIGYTTVERVIGTENQINIGLANDSKTLSEVTVTALGIERSNKTIGYAAQKLENKDITRASETNVIRSLQGRTAGVQITSASGSAGGATRVQIRGPQSFSGNNQPIYVVDGNVISNSALNSTAGTGGDLNNGVDLPNRAADIDPNNVESITILKGPAAAALYGAQAASGAIIITTKKGTGLKGRSQISVNSAVTFERVNRLPNFQNTYGSGFDGEHFADYNTSWGPRMDGRLVEDWRTVGTKLPGAAVADSIPFRPNPDNIRDFFDTGVTYNNSISFTGSNDASNYYVSVSDVRTKSIIPFTNYKRTNITLSGGTRLFNRITTQGSINYIKSGGDRGVQGQSNAGIIQTLVNTPRDVSITDQKDYNDPRYNNTGYYLAGFRNNPYFLLDNNRYTDDVDRLLGSASIVYDPTEWLKFTFRQSLDVYTDRRRQRIVPGTIGNIAGRYIEDNVFGRFSTTDAFATVTKELGENFVFRANAGTNYQQRFTERTVNDGQGIVVPDLYDLSNLATAQPVVKNNSETRLLGLFGDVQLTYRDYLSLNVTGRNDWSSTLPRVNRSFFYPSANVSFVFSDAFNIDEKYLSMGKLRANVASVGKAADPYAIQTIFTRTTVDDGFQGQYVFPYGSVPAFRVGNVLGNPDLKSELTTAWEVGTELGFLNNRLSLDLTYYNSKSEDIIVAVPIPSTSGFTAITSNAGTMRNRGIEVAINATPIAVENGFRWDLNVNYTRNRNEVLAVTSNTPNIGLGGLASPALEARVGQPYGSFFGSVMRRDAEGRVVVNRTTGFPLLSPVQQTLGNIQPDYLAGLSSTFSYRGLALNVLFDTKQGGKFYSRTITSGYFAGTLEETTANDRQPFVYPNSVVLQADGTTVPNAGATAVQANGGYLYWSQVANAGENTLFDASYVKMREASLSYTLPTELVSKVKLTGVQFSLIGRNLFLWTPSSQQHVDPESSSFGTGNTQGYEFFAFPSTRSFGASLRLTL
jgi:TonB-linked SusC/RagA family outer membrane protein